jgi:hypothetical protein
MTIVPTNHTANKGTCGSNTYPCRTRCRYTIRMLFNVRRVHCSQIAEGESRLKQQQKMYEVVRAERNTYSKNLIQAQDDVLDMKRKTKFLVRFLSATQLLCVPQIYSCHHTNVI